MLFEATKQSNCHDIEQEEVKQDAAIQKELDGYVRHVYSVD